MSSGQYDIVVVGAGAAGLMAASELALAGKSVAVIEARDRCGGRIHSVKPPGFTDAVEAGAEFVHGRLSLTLQLLNKAGLRYYPLSGELWKYQQGHWEQQKDFVEDLPQLKKKLSEPDADLSVAAFLQRYLAGAAFEEARFSLKNYVEGYYAANPARSSSFALREELFKSEDEQYRIEGGYAALMQFLFQQCVDLGVRFFFSHPLRAVEWRQNEVKLTTAAAEFLATKTLITLPLGVLQKGTILFSPAIPEYQSAAKLLGYGAVIKIFLEFEQAFWTGPPHNDEHNFEDLFFVFSDQQIPTWWTAHPLQRPLLTGWLAGPRASVNLSDEEILNQALQSLSRLFNCSIIQLQQQLKGSLVVNWQNDPYSAGAYSYEVVNGSGSKKILLTPLKQTVFFAGEALHTGPEIGTVEAALQNGRQTAHSLLVSFA